ncbi:MAG: hypothetical protein HOP11_09560 [Saprospiraceae bacterium]|nr:hypothetical protein [Saprospiraceae bacterium]
MKKILFILILFFAIQLQAQHIEIVTINEEKYIVTTDTLSDGQIVSRSVPSSSLWSDLNNKMFTVSDELNVIEEELLVLNRKKNKLIAIINRLEFLRDSQ